ncbi:TonB-dependent receptor [Frateuria aurantia]
MLTNRKVLPVALAVLLGGSLSAQETTGTIFGRAPAGENESIVLIGTNGIKREVQLPSGGRYSFSQLPVGHYTVQLLRDGRTVDSRTVTITVGGGTQVSFEVTTASMANAKNMEGVSVVASTPPIDTTLTDSRTSLTQAQLQALPLARSAEAIAMLAPGAVAGATATGFSGPTGEGLVSFGGSSINENAYYVNGLNTTDPVNGYGGLQLPYNAIATQQMLTGGYEAKYGRSDGGVINQVGRTGSNDWHYGAQIQYVPEDLSGNPVNAYYPDHSTQAGRIYRQRANNKTWNQTIAGYGGGPLIKDKLFFFLDYEVARSAGQSVGTNATGARETKYNYHDPKYYADLLWNINRNHSIELTAAGSKDNYDGTLYNYNYSALNNGASNEPTGSYISADTGSRTSTQLWTAKYIGHITDAFTVTAQYGRQVTRYGQVYASDPSQIYVAGSSYQNPLYTNGVTGGYSNPLQPLLTARNPANKDKSSNYRIDLSYVLGDHTISAGIDNLNSQDIDDGDAIYSHAGYAWQYGTATPNQPFNGGYLVAPASGYYVDKYVYNTSATVQVKQRGQYIQDAWQATDRLLINLGLRNDQFTNYNPAGQAYLRQTKPQWAPRFGFSWDVFGDSSFKVFGNAGRYYLAMPAAPALRAAGASTYTKLYYSYTGIDPATGYPINAVPLDTQDGVGVPYVVNGENGSSPDPRTVSAQNLKSEYQDEYILGFEKSFAGDWIFGTKLTYRSLKNAIDDWCDTGAGGALLKAAAAAGYDTSKESPTSCYLMNPGRANTYLIPNASGGYDTVKVSKVQSGLPQLRRNYYAAEFHLRYAPMNGRLFLDASYVYSRSYGNEEGEVDSIAGTSSSPGQTQAWDYAQIMNYANGLLPNNRSHVFKVFGTYHITPEWLVGVNFTLASGMPRVCFGAWGAHQTDPIAYGNDAYHYCGGKPSRPGDAGSSPWTHPLALSVEYRPDFARHRLAFSADVFNVFNEQKPVQYYSYLGLYGSQPGKAANLLSNPAYGVPISYETPRYVRFGVSYDF